MTQTTRSPAKSWGQELWEPCRLRTVGGKIHGEKSVSTPDFVPLDPGRIPSANSPKGSPILPLQNLWQGSFSALLSHAPKLSSAEVFFFFLGGGHPIFCLNPGILNLFSVPGLRGEKRGEATGFQAKIQLLSFSSPESSARGVLSQVIDDKMASGVTGSQELSSGQDVQLLSRSEWQAGKAEHWQPTVKWLLRTREYLHV